AGEWELTAAPPRDRGVALPVWPTVWVAILVAALWLRLGAIDAVPLAPDEAARALEARDIWRGTAGPYSTTPLLPNLLSVWFALFTAADGPARVPSALAGWALCLTPLLFRPRLGTGPALAGTALLLDTLLLTRPSGLQAGLVDPFTGWLATIRFSAAALFSGALLGVHEVLLLALAAVGAAAALRDAFGRFLAAWALASLALA